MIIMYSPPYDAGIDDYEDEILNPKANCPHCNRRTDIEEFTNYHKCPVKIAKYKAAYATMGRIPGEKPMTIREEIYFTISDLCDRCIFCRGGCNADLCTACMSKNHLCIECEKTYIPDVLDDNKNTNDNDSLDISDVPDVPDVPNIPNIPNILDNNKNTDTM